MGLRPQRERYCRRPAPPSPALRQSKRLAPSARFVAVLARLELFALVVQRGQCGRQLTAGLRRLDPRVQVASRPGEIRVEETLPVAAPEGRPLLRRAPP